MIIHLRLRFVIQSHKSNIKYIRIMKYIFSATSIIKEYKDDTLFLQVVEW